MLSRAVVDCEPPPWLRLVQEEHRGDRDNDDNEYAIIIASATDSISYSTFSLS